MNIASLIIEILLFGLGLYLYLFAIGQIRSKDPEAQKKMEAFRSSNKVWMRYGGLALMAIMLINIVLHIQEMTS
ncbi:MAG: hypothetical protein HRU40_03120 [Saprospiraceae bacterium]|nr:hypothetical protein [Saprospiraceae bacterium]